MGGNPKTPYYAGLTKKTADGRIVYNGEVRWVRHKLDQPNDWKRPHRIFVNSMSDLFHEQVPDLLIREVWDVMAAYDWHTYLILTKRPERMAQIVPTLHHLPNVQLGTSIENQKAADERISHLLKTPAAVRWLSVEPMLGPVNLGDYLGLTWERCGSCGDRYPDVYWADDKQWEQVVGDTLTGLRCPPCFKAQAEAAGLTPRMETLRPALTRLDWIVVGGESGPRARPMHPDWARSLRDQCQAAGVPFFFKQWGEWISARGLLEPDQWPYAFVAIDPDLPDSHADGVMRVGKKAAGRELDGRTWDEYPETP